MYAAGEQRINQACKWKAGQKRWYYKYYVFSKFILGFMHGRLSHEKEERVIRKKKLIFFLRRVINQRSITRV